MSKFKFLGEYRSWVGKKLPFLDKETGLSWDIEIFEVYESSTDNGTYFLLDDNIKVRVGGLTKMKGMKAVVDRILELYGIEINNLEYKNG